MNYVDITERENKSKVCSKSQKGGYASFEINYASRSFKFCLERLIKRFQNAYGNGENKDFLGCSFLLLQHPARLKIVRYSYGMLILLTATFLCTGIASVNMFFSSEF